MRTIRHITVSTLAALSLLAAYLLTAVAAAAGPVQPHEGNGFPDSAAAVAVPSQVAPSSTIVTTGSPWWTFALIAAAAALVAVAATLLVTRLYHRSATRPAIV
jgi:hypothetical protein